MEVLKVLKSPVATESKFLIYSIAFTIVCHGAAMLAMLAFLLPGIPGGSHPLVTDRIAYIASHPLIWRLGWFPWQMTALSDLVMAIALVRTAWIPKPSAWGSLGFTVVAILVEQPAEFRWVTQGVDIAQSKDFSEYLMLESQLFHLTSHWAALLYTIAAIFWSLSLSKTKAWSVWMTRLSVVLWGLLLVVSIVPLAFPIVNASVVSVGNAIGFNLMMAWFVGAFYLVKKRA